MTRSAAAASIVGAAVFMAVLAALRVELRSMSLAELAADIVRVPHGRLAAAAVLTALNYVVLTGYDFLAFIYIGKRLSAWRVMLTSFLAYAIANNVSLAMLSGASVRYRFYPRWGITAAELSRLFFSYSTTFWLGLFALGGVSLIVAPLAPDSQWPGRSVAAPAGWLLLLIPLAYVLSTMVRRSPLRVRRFSLPVPAPSVAVAQLALSVVDWVLAGAVLFVLLPAGVPFLVFIRAFLVAILLGIISHVPGGLGVFEALMLLLLGKQVDAGQLLPALVVYRTVYYLIPFVLAVIVLVVDELVRRRGVAARTARMLVASAQRNAPRALAAFTFVAGIVLLFSGATPAEHGRLLGVGRVLPLGVIEASHFLASVAGAALLVVSQGLARRLDGAYYLTASLIIVGIATSFVKGFDFEEAALLCGVLALLVLARDAFDRRAAFFETRFSAAWIVSVVLALGASLWLGFFAFKHVEYSHDLWWQFELRGDASRFLRASVGAGVLLFVVALTRLIGYAPHEAPLPSASDLEDAARIIAGQRATSPYLALGGDKSLLFDEERRGFVMYGVQGRTWVALGDPVCPEDRMAILIRLFLDRCRDFGGLPVFYQVTPSRLHYYADLGMTLVKIGEEAKVDLHAFTLEGGHAAKFRKVIRRLERDGVTFRIVAPARVPSILSELREVSDEWLAAKASAEKGFSLGRFDEAYLSRLPVAVLEQNGRVLAFSNLWTGAGHGELSIDLMRHRREVPNGAMEALLVHMMLWGRAQAYRWFVLGMAPLSGVVPSPVHALWNRLGGFVYEHGEAFYGFQGLRAYKEKFDPVWEARYLACAGGWQLPRVLADISALVAGGYRRIFLKGPVHQI